MLYTRKPVERVMENKSFKMGKVIPWQSDMIFNEHD